MSDLSGDGWRTQTDDSWQRLRFAETCQRLEHAPKASRDMSLLWSTVSGASER